MLEARAGSHGGPLGRLEDAVPDALEHSHVGMPRLVVGFGVVGHDVRGHAAFPDDVVDAGFLWDVLPHQVDHVVQSLEAVERRTPALG